jgi:hypothetical protein
MALEDDIWALNRLADPEKTRPSSWRPVGEGSYRYRDSDAVVHRAWWQDGRWTSLCGLDAVKTLPAKDPGAVTCIGCIGNGA